MPTALPVTHSVTQTVGEWRMWAGREDGMFWNPSPERWCPEAHGHTAVPVVVREDAAGPCWGWIDAGGDVPEMIQPAEPLFVVQFPYGPEAEQERGKGRIVRLTIEEAE